MENEKQLRKQLRLVKTSDLNKYYFIELPRRHKNNNMFFPTRVRLKLTKSFEYEYRPGISRIFSITSLNVDELEAVVKKLKELNLTVGK